jgi:hypothetical protein
MNMDQRIQLAREELRRIKDDRCKTSEEFRELCRQKEESLNYLKMHIDNAFKRVRAVKMDEHYSRGERPPSVYLHRQSLLLSTTLLTRAQHNYVQLSLSQNKAMAAYMMCTRFVLEDEKETIESKLNEAIRLHAELNSLVEHRYARRIQVQHMALYSIKCKVDLQSMLKPIATTAKEQANLTWKFLSFSTLKTASDDSIHFSDSEDLTELMESELDDSAVQHPSKSRSRSIDLLSMSQHGLSAFFPLDSSSHGRLSVRTSEWRTTDSRTRIGTASTSSLISVPEAKLSVYDPVDMHYTEDSFSFAPMDEQMSLRSFTPVGRLETT